MLSNSISIIKCHSIEFEIRIKFTGKEYYAYHNDSQLDEDAFVSRGEKLGLVTGIVLESEVVDAHGDICSADEIKKTAYRFMAGYKGEGNWVMHKEKNPNLKIVESYIAPVDMSMSGEAI